MANDPPKIPTLALRLKDRIHEIKHRRPDLRNFFPDSACPITQPPSQIHKNRLVPSNFGARVFEAAQINRENEKMFHRLIATKGVLHTTRSRSEVEEHCKLLYRMRKVSPPKTARCDLSGPREKKLIKSLEQQWDPLTTAGSAKPLELDIEKRERQRMKEEAAEVRRQVKKDRRRKKKRVNLVHEWKLEAAVAVRSRNGYALVSGTPSTFQHHPHPPPPTTMYARVPLSSLLQAVPQSVMANRSIHGSPQPPPRILPALYDSGNAITAEDHMYPAHVGDAVVVREQHTDESPHVVLGGGGGGSNGPNPIGTEELLQHVYEQNTTSL